MTCGKNVGNPDDSERTAAMLVDGGSTRMVVRRQKGQVNMAGSLTIEGICEATTVPVKFSWWDVLQELRLTL